MTRVTAGCDLPHSLEARAGNNVYFGHRVYVDVVVLPHSETTSKVVAEENQK
jgi:hypothetical protein